MSNHTIFKRNPSSRGLLIGSISKLLEAKSREEWAYSLCEQKKISDEKYLEANRDLSTIRSEVIGLLELLVPTSPISEEEFSKALQIAPNCLNVFLFNEEK